MATTVATEQALLGAVKDEGYRAALRALFDLTRELGLAFDWGTSGVAIKLVAHRGRPTTIVWVYPPGQMGFKGMTDVTLGYPTGSLASTAHMRAAAAEYAQRVSRLPGAVAVTAVGFTAFSLEPSTVTENLEELSEALRDLARASAV